MGDVYKAKQLKPVRRTVAIKIIKPGMDSKEVIARFEAERQALALMDHPNIARVLDVGATEQGRPWFAMELVRGDSVTAFADEERLSVRHRLDLFMQICDAFDIPILVLCDTPGMMVGPDVEETALVRHCSRLFVTGANVSVPMVSVSTRRLWPACW